MPYVAQRLLTMGGQKFAPPGNAYDLPHIMPSDLVERTPFRSLANMLNRGVIKQVEALPDARAVPAPAAPALDVNDLEANPRVEKEGNGWWTVDGERVHGRNGVRKALELGG